MYEPYCACVTLSRAARGTLVRWQRRDRSAFGSVPGHVLGDGFVLVRYQPTITRQELTELRAFVMGPEGSPADRNPGNGPHPELVRHAGGLAPAQGRAAPLLGRSCGGFGSSCVACRVGSFDQNCRCQLGERVAGKQAWFPRRGDLSQSGADRLKRHVGSGTRGSWYVSVTSGLRGVVGFWSLCRGPAADLP